MINVIIIIIKIITNDSPNTIIDIIICDVSVVLLNVAAVVVVMSCSVAIIA